jgi:hypothetical protein
MENKEKRGKEGFNLDKKIKENELTRRQLLGENAVFLTEIFDKKLYREILGDDQAEWSGYLAQTDVYYTRNEVKNLIGIYRKFTLELGIELKNYVDIFSEHMNRLVNLISVVDKESVEEWLEKARQLTSRDWNYEMRKVRHLVVSDDCKHKYQQYEICKVCGEKHKI